MSRLAWASVLCASVIAGCATIEEPEHESDSRYTMDQDRGPDEHFDVSDVVEPVPFYEPLSRGGNDSPYTVWGETYHVMDSAQGYVEEGIASWYGQKFHGHTTSNGETYDMFQLTAAHKSLPLPTFVRVTNLDNDRSVIVRVNDRGPFHEDRVIDLSYAAAKVLGFEGQGTAPVRVEAVATRPDGEKEEQDEQPLQASEEPPESEEEQSIVSISSDDTESLFVQVGAFGTLASASRLKTELTMVSDSDVRLVSGESNGEDVHRVWIGPFEKREAAEQAKAMIRDNELGQPIIVSRPAS